jgi:hypothetical protein
VPNLQTGLQETPDYPETAEFTAVSAKHFPANVAAGGLIDAVVAIFLMWG